MATDSIQVAIRVRPLIKREKDSSQQTNWKVNGKTITQTNNGKAGHSSCFTFDQVFDQIDTTGDVYEKFAKPIIVSAMLGFNATIFAYGQTSSGKTYTMLGDRESPGIIPRAIMYMFDHINEDPSREYLLVVQYMEIYNEVITDLLNPSNKNFKIHENSKKEVFVKGITQNPVSGSEEIYRLMMEGEKNRHFGETNMNEKSSRSHAIFSIHIESRERVGPEVEQESDDADGAVLVSQLNLVDLAGSERVSLTGAEGQRLKEGAHINKSLFTLGSVIAKLSEGESFVPFRDSKLTRILQSSLGGNAKTGILCTITPASIEESVSTLKFASRAKTIKNCPSVNEVLDDDAMLKRMKKEIRDLRQQITKLQENTCSSELQSEKEKFQKQLEETKADHEKEIQRLTASLLYSTRPSERDHSNGLKRAKLAKRRETWCPGAGALLSSNPLESAAAVAKSVLSNFDSEDSQSSSSEDCDTNLPEFRSSSNFEKILVKEEKKRRSGEKLRRVKFSDNPPSLYCRLPSIADVVDKEVQTENNDQRAKYQSEIEDLEFKILQLTKENNDNLKFIEQSNDNWESLMSQKSELEDKLHYAIGELKAANADKIALKEKINSLDKNMDAEKIRAENKELRERVSGLENECNLMNSCAEDLQGEVNELKKENLALKYRLQEGASLEEKASENQSILEAKVKDYKEKLEDTLKEFSKLKLNLQEEVMLKEKYLNESRQLKICESSLKEELENERSILMKEREDMEQLIIDLKDSMGDVESERAVLQKELQCLLVEKDYDIDSLKKELEVANKNVADLEEESRKKVESLTKMYEERVSDRDATISKLFEDVAKLKGCEDAAEREATKVAELELERKALGAKYEELGRTKEHEIAELRRNLENKEEELVAVSHELQKHAEEKECDPKGQGEEMQNQLTTQIANLNEENQALQEAVQKMTTERDEIKNELSDAITDSVAIQKDMFEAHQKVTNYKERLLQMNQDYEDMCSKATALEELLNTKAEQEEARTAQDNPEADEQLPNIDEYAKILEENETLKKLNNELNLANERLEKKYESYGDIESLRTQLEFKQQELQDVSHEVDTLRQSNKELENSLVETKEKYAELEKSFHAMENNLANKEACYDQLCKEVNEYKQAVTSGKAQSKTFNIELQELEKVHAETVRELHNEQKEHQSLRTRYEQLKEQAEDNKVSLLRDSNRDLTQQKELNKMRSERRETICAQAQLRSELDKERDENKKKVLELETRCRHLESEKDLAEHKSEVSQKQLEDTKQQMKEMEVMYSQVNSSKSIVPNDGYEKTAQRLKQVEFNLDITKQKFEKAELRLKELEHENRQLKGADIRNNNLIEERDSIKVQLVNKTEKLNETTRKVNELSIEVTQLRSHVDKLTAETKKQKVNLEKKADKIEELEIQLVQLQESTSSSQNFEEERNSLRKEVEGLQSRLKSKSMKCEELAYENKELLRKNARKSFPACNTSVELETLKTRLIEKAQKLEKVKSEFDSLKNQYENLSIKYDEQLMLSNQKEMEVEEAACLKEEIKSLKSQIASYSYHSNDGDSQKNEKSLHPAEESNIHVEYQAEMINSLNMTIQTKDEELEHMTFLVDERDLEIKEAHKNMQLCQNDLKKLEETIKEKTELYEEVQSEAELLKVELEKAEGAHSEAKRRIDELMNIIKEQETEMIRLAEKLQTAKLKLTKSEEETDKKYEDLMSSMENLRTELSELKSSKNETEQRNLELENRLNTEDFRKETEKNDENIEKHKLELKAAKQLIEEHKSKLEEASASIERLKKVVTNQEEELLKCNDDSLKKCEQLQIQNEELESRLAAAQQQIEEQNFKLEDLLNRAEDSEVNASLREELELLRKETKQFEIGLKEEQQLNYELKIYLKEKENEVEELLNKCNDDDHDAIREKLIESTQALILSRQEVEDLRNSRESLEEEFEEAKRKITDFETRNSELQNLVRANDESLLKIQNELEHTVKKILLSEEKEEEYKAKILSLTRELESSSAEHKNEIHEKSEMQIMAKQAELEDLQEQFVQQKQESTKQKETINQQRKQLIEIQSLFIAKQKECTDLRERMKSDNQDKVNTLKKEIAEVSSALSNERLRNEDLQEALDSSKRHIAAIEDVLQKTCQQKSELEFQLHQDGVRKDEGQYSKSFSDIEAENTELKNALKQLQNKLYNDDSEFEEQLKNKVTSSQDDNHKLNIAVKENERLRSVITEQQAQLVKYVQKIENLESHAKKTETESVSWIKYNEETNRLKKIIDEVQDELDEALMKIRGIEQIDKDTTEQRVIQLQNTIDEQKVELNQYIHKIQTLEDLTKKKDSEDSTALYKAWKPRSPHGNSKFNASEESTSAVKEKSVSWIKYNEETNRLKKIIDEVQDELDEALMKIRGLEQIDKNTAEQRVIQLQNTIDEQKVELNQYIHKIQTLEDLTKKKDSEGVSWEKYHKETERLKKIIDEVQDELDEALLKINTLETQHKEVGRTELHEALKEIDQLKKALKESSAKAQSEENLESLRIVLAGKNMKIQELQYKGMKIAEENERLRKEVQYGYAKLSKMKQEVRRLRDESSLDNTMQMKTTAPPKDTSDVGVVSSVALYSLKAKVGKLESENEKLKLEKEQLEKDKVTLSLLKTDAGNQVSLLTSEIYCLRKQNKELRSGYRATKGKDDQNASQHVLASSNTPDDGICHAQTRQDLTTDKGHRTTEAISREVENKPVQSNWLTPSKANDMLQDKPSQCQHQ